MTKVRPWVILSFKLILTTLLFAYIIKKVNLHDIKQNLAHFQSGYWWLAMLALFIQFLVGSYRWKLTLDALGEPLRWPLAFRYSWSALFFNQALPASLGGDASRVWFLRKHGHTLGTTVNSILIGHMGMLASLLAIAILSLMQVSLGNSLSYLYWLVPLLLLGVLSSIFLICWFGNHLPRPLPSLRRQSLLFLGQKWVLSSFLILSVMNSLFLILSIYWLSLALAIQVNPFSFLYLMPLVIIASTLPISIGGWGPRESAMILLLTQVGVPSSLAFTLSVLLALSTILLSLPGALFYLWDRHPTQR